MTDLLSNIARLRRLADDVGQLGDDGAWLANGLRCLLDGGGAITADQALGIAARRGEWPWWRLERRERERVAAQALVDAFGSCPEALTVARRYAAGRGRHAQAGDTYRDLGTQAAHDFVIAVGKVPKSRRTLARAIAKRDR